jgi:hypothetical protein
VNGPLKGVRQPNVNEHAMPAFEDGTSAERMGKFDRLPKPLRRFLAQEAPYDFAVSPFYATMHFWGAAGSDVHLRARAREIVRAEAASAYGPDHPQAKEAGMLALTPKITKRRRIG